MTIKTRDEADALLQELVNFFEGYEISDVVSVCAILISGMLEQAAPENRAELLCIMLKMIFTYSPDFIPLAELAVGVRQ